MEQQKTPPPLAGLEKINMIDAVSPPHYRENQQMLSSWDEERGVQFVRLSLSLELVGTQMDFCHFWPLSKREGEKAFQPTPLL